MIRPHTPTDNGILERCQRTIGELIEEHELEDFTQAQTVIGGIVRDYNHDRLHSSLSYLRPVDDYRGDPTTLLAERRSKVRATRAEARTRPETCAGRRT